MAVGWFHLATFLTLHLAYRSGHLNPWIYLTAWAVELAVAVVVLRRMVTANGRYKAPPLVGLLTRVWITFLILAFNVLALNHTTAMPPEWFKPVWATLSTFGFAMMAWIVSLWFLIPAVLMSLTGLLMHRDTADAYLIWGVSWCSVLHLVAFGIEWARRVRLNAVDEDDENDLAATARVPRQLRPVVAVADRARSWGASAGKSG